jgi:hypothetical protein
MLSCIGHAQPTENRLEVKLSVYPYIRYERLAGCLVLNRYSVNG